jgi:type IV secretion system protein TrbL
VVLPLLLIDLGLNQIFENIAEAIYEGAFDIIELMFSETIGNLLKIPPSRLTTMQEMWSLSVAVYFSLLAILGLSYLGMFQLFPEAKKTDPYRFIGRAFAATISLFIVNPPGGMSNLFSRGAFAWALEISNILIDYFLLNMTYTPDNYTSATTGLIAGGTLGYFGALTFGGLMLLVVGILLVVLYVVLAARELVILVTFGLYPLLIVFWVADMGPMKYGKQLSAKLFKATGMLIPLGILLAAIMSAAGQMMTGSLVDLGANPLVSAVMVTLPMPVAAFMMITLTMSPLKMAGVGLGAAVGQAQSAMSKAGRKGKSMVRGGRSSGAGSDGLLGGVAGGGVLGAMGQDDPEHGGTQPQSRVAPEPDSTTVVPGQSTLTQFEDGDSPEGAATADNRQEFTDPDVGTDSDQDTAAPVATADSGREYTDPDAGADTSTDTATADAAADTTDSGQDTDAGQSLSDMDPNALSEAEFAERWRDADPQEQAKTVQNILQNQNQANSKRFLSEAMGPAGGAIATVATGALGLSGGVAAAGGVLVATGVAYAGKQAIQNDSVRTGITNTVKAPVQLGKQAQQEITNRFGFTKQSAAETNGGSSDSGGSTADSTYSNQDQN